MCMPPLVPSVSMKEFMKPLEEGGQAIFVKALFAPKQNRPV